MELLSNRLLVDVSIEGVSSWNPNLSCYQIGSSSIFHIYLVAMKTTWRICDPQVKQSHKILVIMSWFRHPCYAPDFVFPFIFCASLDPKVGFCCNMRRIIVSDFRFQILCKSCMVLIKTPIMRAWKQWTILNWQRMPWPLAKDYLTKVRRKHSELRSGDHIRFMVICSRSRQGCRCT